MCAPINTCQSVFIQIKWDFIHFEKQIWVNLETIFIRKDQYVLCRHRDKLFEVSILPVRRLVNMLLWVRCKQFEPQVITNLYDYYFQSRSWQIPIKSLHRFNIELIHKHELYVIHVHNNNGWIRAEIFLNILHQQRRRGMYFSYLK